MMAALAGQALLVSAPASGSRCSDQRSIPHLSEDAFLQPTNAASKGVGEAFDFDFDQFEVVQVDSSHCSQLLEQLQLYHFQLDHCLLHQSELAGSMSTTALGAAACIFAFIMA